MTTVRHPVSGRALSLLSGVFPARCRPTQGDDPDGDTLRYAIITNTDPDGDRNAFRIEGDLLLVNDQSDLLYDNTPELSVLVEASDDESSCANLVTVKLLKVGPQSFSPLLSESGSEVDGSASTFKLTHTEPLDEAIEVGLLLRGTATPGQDYAPAGTDADLGLVVTFPEGRDSVSLSLPTLTDQVSDAGEASRPSCLTATSITSTPDRNVPRQSLTDRGATARDPTRGELPVSTGTALPSPP